jgi:hypothetical protein
MLKAMRNIALALLAIVSGVGSSTRAAVLAPAQARMLLLVQSVDSAGASSVTGTAIIAGNTPAGLGANKIGTPIAYASQVAGVRPWRSVGSLSQADVIKSATAHMAGNVKRLAEDLSAYLASQGYASVWFTYEQTLLLNGRPKYLAWTLFVDGTGRVEYADPQLLDDQPLIVYAIYTPLAVKKGLPQGWQFPNAGTLRWQKRDLRFAPVSAWQSRDLGGVFDQPQGGVTDPDFGLKCLADGRWGPACPAGVLDVKTLIDQESAVFAVFDYVRMLQPVYTAASGGRRVAAAAIDVYERSVRLAECCCDTAAMSFTNKFRIGYKLELSADRVLVNPDGSWSLENHLSSVALSPTEDRTRSVPTALPDVAGLNSKVISPESGVLVDIASFAPGQIVNFAAITYR